jgi:hypothetical protein
MGLANSLVGTKSLLAPVIGLSVYGMQDTRTNARRSLDHPRLGLFAVVQ